MQNSRVISQEIELELKKVLSDTTRSIKICVAWINISLFYNIFSELASRGVLIEIICNDDATNRRYALPVPKGVKLYLFKPLNGGITHNKFAIIDDSILCNGSYNWSKNAHNNHENITVIKNDMNLLSSFSKIFEELKVGIIIRDSGELSKTGICEQCRSTTYNLLLISYLNIKNKTEEQIDYVFEICKKNTHIKNIVEYTQDISDDDVFIDDPEYENSIEESIEEVIQWKKSLDYYKKELGVNIHVIGMLESNFNLYNKGYANDLEYWIKINWRDPNYTNMIPDNLEIDFIMDEIM